MRDFAFMGVSSEGQYPSESPLNGGLFYVSVYI